MNKSMCILSKTDGLCYVTSMYFDATPEGVRYTFKYKTSSNISHELSDRALTIEHALRKIKPKAYFEQKYPELFL